MGEIIIAKVWREMTTIDILDSLSIAVSVLENRKIDKKLHPLLLDVGLRCIELVKEQR